MATGGPIKLEEGEVSVDDLHFELMSLRSEYDNLTRVNQLYQQELNRTEDQVQQVTELTAKLNDKLESYKYADLEENIKEDETLKQLKSKLKEVTKLKERKDKEVRKMRRKLETTTAKERILKENKIMATKVTLLQAGLKVLEGMKERSSLEETQDEEEGYSDEEPEVTLYPAWVQEDEEDEDGSDKSSVKVQKGDKKKKRATAVKSVTNKFSQQKNLKKKSRAPETMKTKD